MADEGPTSDDPTSGYYWRAGKWIRRSARQGIRDALGYDLPLSSRRCGRNAHQCPAHYVGRATTSSRATQKRSSAFLSRGVPCGSVARFPGTGSRKRSIGQEEGTVASGGSLRGEMIAQPRNLPPVGGYDVGIACFNTRHSPAQATWNRRVRPSGISTSCSGSLDVITASQPSQARPEPKPPHVFTGSSAGRVPCHSLSMMRADAASPHFNASARGRGFLRCTSRRMRRRHPFPTRRGPRAPSPRSRRDAPRL